MVNTSHSIDVLYFSNLYNEIKLPSQVLGIITSVAAPVFAALAVYAFYNVLPPVLFTATLLTGISTAFSLFLSVTSTRSGKKLHNLAKRHGALSGSQIESSKERIKFLEQENEKLNVSLMVANNKNKDLEKVEVQLLETRKRNIELQDELESARNRHINEIDSNIFIT